MVISHREAGTVVFVLASDSVLLIYTKTVMRKAVQNIFNEIFTVLQSQVP